MDSGIFHKDDRFSDGGGSAQKIKPLGLDRIYAFGHEVVDRIFCDISADISLRYKRSGPVGLDDDRKIITSLLHGLGNLFDWCCLFDCERHPDCDIGDALKKVYMLEGRVS